MKLLDCTLRDGGYYNNWDFDFDLIYRYLRVMSEAKIDYVELGLRQFKQSSYLGAFAYTPESLLNCMDLPDGPVYGVMIDAKTILGADAAIDESIAKLFVPFLESKLGLIRVAAHPHEVKNLEPVISSLKILGYEVALNIMQISLLSEQEILEVITPIDSWTIKPDVLYFADSLGNMESKDILKVITRMQEVWDGSLGFHSHNNQGLALQNVKLSLEQGVQWIDATIAGMGRGAGNLSMEDVFLNLMADQSAQGSRAILNLANNDFEPLRDKYKFGPSLVYRIAAKHSIHPTFIQTMLADQSVETSTYLEVIESFANGPHPNKYSAEKYKQASGVNQSQKQRDQSQFFGNIAGLHEGEDILIVGSGDSLNNIHDFIPLLVNSLGMSSLGVNIKSNQHFEVDYVCALPNNNLLRDLKQYQAFKNKIITPKTYYQNNIDLFQSTKKVSFYDYEPGNKFLFTPQGLISKFDLSAAYAIACACAMGARRIFLIGFDGYPLGDRRYLQMVELIHFYQELLGPEQLISLTESNYSLRTESLFSHLI
jgi:4-hydroxy 2-oxovalerate aldolase